jgi:hypothetical protein
MGPLRQTVFLTEVVAVVPDLCNNQSPPSPLPVVSLEYLYPGAMAILATPSTPCPRLGRDSSERHHREEERGG